MSLLELLNDAYSAQKNYQDRNFISYDTALQIVTKERIDEWSASHPLCLEHRHLCPQRLSLIDEIRRTNVFVFVILVFAELEYLIKNPIKNKSRDRVLFHTKAFERLCESAGLGNEQTQKLLDFRRYVGVIFAHNGLLNVPRDAVLPFLQRNPLNKYGSYGVLYRVEIAGRHLRDHEVKAFVAEKRIRPMSNPSHGDWEKLFREVQTLQARRSHPNIIPLLASYLMETVESGHDVQTLHLLFPLAETDLADWMVNPQIPSNVARLSRQDRQAYLYRSMYELVSGVSYLHGEIDGTVTAHHDLKPHNILVVDDRLKIADFGHSHLRPIVEGSATEEESKLGTYEYQPPEYWSEDGSQAKVKHGRAFDVWSMGCIIIELATLVIYDWTSSAITEFRNERSRNIHRNRKSPRSVQDGTDASFHNNLVVVNDWIRRLRGCDGGDRLNEILHIATQMLAPKPRNRAYMWEVQIDLYKIIRPHDEDIEDIEQHLCVAPPFIRSVTVQDYKYFNGISHILQPAIKEYTETPLHRAATKGERKRTIQLWELGWPLSLPDSEGKTVLEIMNRSDNFELRELENDVMLMLKAASAGDIKELRRLSSRGLSPLMVNANGRSALHEAMMHSHIDVVDCLLETKAEEQLRLWDTAKLELPLQTAAKAGFREGIERVLKDFPDVNAPDDGYNVALRYAAEASHADVVRMLLSSEHTKISSTLLHAVVKPPEQNESIETLQVLLEADDGHKYLEHYDTWGFTPLLLAAQWECARCFEILLEHGASVHAIMPNSNNLLHILAENGRHDLLEQCIQKFTLEEIRGDPRLPETPIDRAQRCGRKY